MAETKVERRLTRNAAHCKKCDTVIESTHRHDFVSCVCGNFVDGGHEYLRRGGRLSDLEDLSEYTTEPLPEKTEEQKKAEQDRVWLLLSALDKNSI